MSEFQNITAIKDHILVQDMNFDERKLQSGIVLLKDDRTTSGIRPRWAKVFATGPEQKFVSEGQYVLVEHGRWTRGVDLHLESGKITIRRIDPECVLAISDEKPADEAISTAIHADTKSR